MKVRRLNALIWTANVLAIGAITAFGLHSFVLHAPTLLGVQAPRAVPLANLDDDRISCGSLRELPNPLAETDAAAPEVQAVHLIGTMADTAYLYLVGRQTYVNAYLDESVDARELAGWKLKRVTVRSAAFSTPEGERVLALRDGPTGAPAPVRIPDAVSRLEEAFKRTLTADEAYALIQELGEEVMASMMNSKERKVRELAHRLFELARQGGERQKTNPRPL